MIDVWEKDSFIDRPLGELGYKGNKIRRFVQSVLGKVSQKLNTIEEREDLWSVASLISHRKSSKTWVVLCPFQKLY